MSPHLSELRKYVEEGDEDAFQRVVSQYIGLVYGTARRQLNGDAASAADATQVVFTDLAKSAHKLYGGTMLGGWLHRHTCFVTSKMRRAEARRKVREKTAAELSAMEAEALPGWKEIASIVDEALNELGDEERAPVLLRFLEGHSMRSVGLALGVSEDAAQKRTQRALEKLKVLLERKGVVVVSAGALAVGLSSEAAMPVPSGLAASVAGLALSGATVGSFTIVSVLKATLMSKAGLVATVAVLCAGGLFVARQLSPKSGTNEALADASPAISAPIYRASRSIVPGNNEASLAKRVRTPTLAEQALARLKEGVDTNYDEAIIAAINAFRMDFDIAPKTEQPAFRAAIPLLTELWDRKSERVRDFILSTLDRLSPPTDRVVDIYLEQVGSTNGNRVNAATAALMRSGPAARKATMALMDQLQRNYQQKDADPIGSSTARMSLDALANIGPDAAAAVPMLTGLLQDTNLMYRVIGSRAYWHITQDAPTVLPVLTNALLQENSFWAADVLGEMGSAALPAIEGLREAYRTGSPDARLHAYQTLLALDPSDPPDIQGIRDLLETRNPITRIGAIEALWQYSHDPQQVLPAMIKVLPEEPEFSLNANKILTILGEMGPDATDALPVVRKILERPAGADITRVIASNTWVQIAPETVVPSIVNR